MATRIVGHEGLDMDCCVGMLALEFALVEIVGYKGDIEFSFIPQGQTFWAIPVNPANQFEVRRVTRGRYDERVLGYDERIYHVDCGGSALDHHRPECGYRSAAELVEAAFRLGEKFPEWGRIIRWATESDLGQLNCGCAIPAILRGEHRRLGSGNDEVIFRLARRMIEDLLANEKVRVAAAVPVVVADPVAALMTIQQDDRPAMLAVDVTGFGKVGVIINQPAEILGSLRNRLETGYACRLTVSLTDQGYGILTPYWGHSGNKRGNGGRLDLRGLGGIVSEIRIAEMGGAEAVNDAGLGDRIDDAGTVADWYAQEVDGVIVNLLNGSAKSDPGVAHRSRLPPARVLKIVLDCLEIQRLAIKV